VNTVTVAPPAAGDNRHVARRVSSPEFVSRSEELAVLQTALERAAGGDAAAVFVAGESGVGKTRLLRELQRRAEEAGARVLRGDCLAFGAGELPYAPIAGALRGLMRELGPEDFDELVGARRGELARLLPELGGEPIGDGDGMTSTGEPLAQARLFGLLRALLDQLGADAPVVFVIDDLQWADRSTLEFLSSLLRGLRDERLLVVCTYRSDELHRRHPLRPFLAEEERREHAERLELAPFSMPELAEQVTGILGAAAAPDLVARLHERSEGNAFFAEELVAASAEGDGPLPSSLRDVLTLRLEALSDDARTVLSAAAVAGRRSGHRLLSAVARLPEDALLEALRESVAHHVLVLDDDGYAFRHALLQEATYADLLPGERTALHLRLAEALTADPALAEGAAAAELAQHWRAAHRLPDALASFVRAGIDAERASAFAEAGGHFEAALEIWDLVEDAPQRAGLSEARVVARAAEARHRAGDHHRAVSLGQTAIELVDRGADVTAQALARERLGRYLWLAGDSDRSLAMYREAVRILPADPPTAARARLLGGLGQILMLRGPSEEARACCERAIEIARTVGDRVVEGHALNSLGVIMASNGDWTNGERSIREAMGIAEELASFDDILRAVVNLSDCVDQRGRMAEAAEMALAGARRAETSGVLSYAGFLEGDAGWRLARIGALDEAEAIIQRRLASRLAGVAEITMRGTAGHVALRRGRFDEAEAHFGRAEDALGASSDSMWLGNRVDGQVELALWRAEPDRAWELATRVLDLIVEHEYLFYSVRLYTSAARAAAELVQRARTLGDDARAEHVLREARAIHARLRALMAPERWVEGPPPEVLGHEAVCAAELWRADGESSPEAWAAAASHFATLAMPFELAYARWRQAEAIVLGAGDRSAAAEALREAARLAGELRAEPLLTEIAGLARRARIGLDDAPAPAAADSELDALGLTARERTVLELVADGRTNREIGEMLFISDRTASVHVSRILAKLGVRSRVEAATAAHRLGLSGDSAPGDGGRG
jgi:DNA-binding CsgD family transcriptional regulator/tetratricopeptide (TPR) repeat protein